MPALIKSFKGFSMPFHYIVIIILIIYIAICFGKIASKYGKNPFICGILSIVTPINLIILGYWAFSNKKQKNSVQLSARMKKKKT